MKSEMMNNRVEKMAIFRMLLDQGVEVRRINGSLYY